MSVVNIKNDDLEVQQKIPNKRIGALIDEGGLPVVYKPSEVKEVALKAAEGVGYSLKEIEGGVPDYKAPFKEDVSIIPDDVHMDSECTEATYADYVEMDNSDLDYTKKMKDELQKTQLHQMALAKLMQPEYAAERQQFYNNVAKETGIPSDEASISAYLDTALGDPKAEQILRDSAPSAYDHTLKDIESYDLDSDLEKKGINPEKITASLRRELQLSGAHAKAIGGEEGSSMFREALGRQKDNIMKGLGDPKVSLAISGALLGATVMVGAGPIGPIIGSIKFASKLLQTEKGQKFQEVLKKSTMNFLEKMGVPTEKLEAAIGKVKDVIDKATSTKLGKIAKVGLGVGLLLVAGEVAMPEGQSMVDNIVKGAEGLGNSASELAESVSNAVVVTPDMIATVDDALLRANASMGAGDPLDAVLTLAKAGVIITTDLAENLDFTKINPAELATLVEADAIAQSTGLAHVVVQGDTLSEIAEKALIAQGIPDPSYTQSMNLAYKIAEESGIENVDLIQPGQVLSIPGKDGIEHLEQVATNKQVDVTAKVVDAGITTEMVTANNARLEAATTPEVAAPVQAVEVAASVVDSPVTEMPTHFNTYSTADKITFQVGEDSVQIPFDPETPSDKIRAIAALSSMSEEVFQKGVTQEDVVKLLDQVGLSVEAADIGIASGDMKELGKLDLASPDFSAPEAVVPEVQEAKVVESSATVSEAAAATSEIKDFNDASSAELDEFAAYKASLSMPEAPSAETIVAARAEFDLANEEFKAFEATDFGGDLEAELEAGVLAQEKLEAAVLNLDSVTNPSPTNTAAVEMQQAIDLPKVDAVTLPSGGEMQQAIDLPNVAETTTPTNVDPNLPDATIVTTTVVETQTLTGQDALDHLDKISHDAGTMSFHENAAYEARLATDAEIKTTLEQSTQQQDQAANNEVTPENSIKLDAMEDPDQSQKQKGPRMG